LNKPRQFQRKWSFTRAHVTPLQTATQLVLSVSVIMAVIIFGFNYRVISPERKNLRETGTYRIYESDAIRKILDMRDPSKTLSSSGRESVTAYLPHKKQTLFIRRPEVKHQENLPRPQEFVPLRTENTATVSAVAATMIQNQPLPEIRKSAIAVFDRNGKEVSRFDPDGELKSQKPLWVRVVRHGLLNRAEMISGSGNRDFDTFCLDKISSSALPGGTYVIYYINGNGK